MPEALSMEEGVADLERRAAEAEAAWHAATVAQGKSADLERELAISEHERIAAWQVAGTARGRVEVLEREQRLNKAIVAAYWAIRTIAYNSIPAADALVKIRAELEKAANGQRHATETPGDQAMVAAQQQRGDIDNIASRAAHDVATIMRGGT